MSSVIPEAIPIKNLDIESKPLSTPDLNVVAKGKSNLSLKDI